MPPLFAGLIILLVTGSWPAALLVFALVGKVEWLVIVMLIWALYDGTGRATKHKKESSGMKRSKQIQGAGETTMDAVHELSKAHVDLSKAPDLRRADLRGVPDVRTADLRGADLSKADVSQSGSKKIDLIKP